MLTVDDCNTIIEKYGDSGFWYTLDLTKCSQTVGVTTYYDFMEVKYQGSGSYIIKMNNPFFHGLHYCTLNGQPHGTVLSKDPYDDNKYGTPYTSGTFPDAIHLFFTTDDSIDLDYNFGVAAPMILPVNGLQIPVVNGEFDDKFYFTVARGGIRAYTIDDVEVEAETDEQGTFLRLPSAEDCIIGVKSSSNSYPLYKVTFREFKTLPLLNIPTLYRGTPQKITLINSDTEEEITDFQAYYNGRLLKDNILDLPYDAPDIIDVTVDLLDPEYPYSTVKLKVNTELKLCTNRNKVINAINDGIKTIQVTPPTSVIVTLSDVDLKDVTFINSKVGFQQCTLDNVSIIETEDFENGLIRISNNTIMNNCNLENLTSFQVNTNNGRLNNCTLKDIDLIQSYGIGGTTRELLITGSITNSNIDRLIMISDGNISLTNNNFTGNSTIDYFPNFLYLTGDYTVRNNTFTLEGEWEELAFNMCIIKTTDDFNPSKFINENSFDLNITYEDEPTNTFYYNIVDDDKIRAVRL